MEKFCACGKLIPAERLEVLPDTVWCVTCAAGHPPLLPSADDVCAKASISCQNGFAPNE